MSLGEFNQISAGMSHDQVAEIVGSPGQLSVDRDVAGFHDTIYTWSGCGGLGANANVQFQDDAEVTKAQAGLG